MTMTMKRVAFASLSALCCIVAPRCNAEPLVFIVSYHNVDYAKVACITFCRLNLMRPRRRVSIKNLAGEKWTIRQKISWRERQNANPCAIRVSWDGNLKTNL